MTEIGMFLFGLGIGVLIGIGFVFMVPRIAEAWERKPLTPEQKRALFFMKNAIMRDE